MRLGFVGWLIALAACAACAAKSDATDGRDSDEPSNRADNPSLEAPLDGGSSGESGEIPGPATSYAAAIQKSCHNSYEREEPLLDQLVYHRIRSIELDVHAAKSGESPVAGDWFVYHEDAPFFRDTSCDRLSDCLAQLAAFHEAVPRHEVVTLFVDLKDGFSDGHSAADLDAQITKALGRSRVFGPADARTRCAGAAPSLRDALAGTCGFPTLADLRGKFVVAVTGGGACDAASNVMTYSGDLAFRAPNHDASCPASKGDDVFVNLSFDQRAQAAEARSLGLVPRIYKGGVSGGLDSKDDFDGAIAAGALHAATDKASSDADGWARTHGDDGYPFRCEGCEGHVEPGALLGLRATSGDLWGAADSGFFALAEDASDSSEETWSALTSVPSSHAPEFAKACIVARASDSPGAAYAGACRTFDKNPPRMQTRVTEGGATQTTTSPAIAGVSAEAPAFLRLRVKPSGSMTEVTAEASADARTWVTMGKAQLEGALPLRGFAVSSHDGVPVKALFADPRRSGASVGAASLTKKLAIGAGADGDAFDGIAP